jgi:hypothetical protein
MDAADLLFITSFVGIVVYLKCDTTETSSTLKAYSDLIITLTFSSSLNVLVGETPPEGCAVQTVSAKCECHIMLKVIYIRTYVSLLKKI